jgi:hypothetical protein
MLLRHTFCFFGGGVVLDCGLMVDEVVMSGNVLTWERLDAIRGRCERATPGPWARIDASWCGGEYVTTRHGDPHAGRYICSVDGLFEQSEAEGCGAEGCGERDVSADMAFIAAARVDVPLLVEEVERLRREVALLLATYGDDTGISPLDVARENAALKRRHGSF